MILQVIDNDKSPSSYCEAIFNSRLIFKLIISEVSHPESEWVEVVVYMLYRAPMVSEQYSHHIFILVFFFSLCASFQHRVLFPHTCIEEGVTWQVTLRVIRLYSSLASCILIFSSRATSSGFWKKNQMRITLLVCWKMYHYPSLPGDSYTSYISITLGTIYFFFLQGDEMILVFQAVKYRRLYGSSTPDTHNRKGKFLNPKVNSYIPSVTKQFNSTNSHPHTYVPYIPVGASPPLGGRSRCLLEAHEGTVCHLRRKGLPRHNDAESWSWRVKLKEGGPLY